MNIWYRKKRSKNESNSKSWSSDWYYIKPKSCNYWWHSTSKRNIYTLGTTSTCWLRYIWFKTRYTTRHTFETGEAVSYSIDNTNGVVTEKITKKDKSLEDVKEVDEKGKAILDENGNQRITKGLKSIYIESIKQQANSSLSLSDWLVTRFAEDNTKKIPDDVKTYRKKVRDTSDSIITKIQATKTLSDLKKLFNDATIKDGKITTPNTMDSMPVSTIQEYER